MVQRVLAREARGAAPSGDDALMARALALAEAYLPARRAAAARGVVGSQPASPLGFVHAEHGNDPPLPPPASHAGLGRRLRPAPRAGPPGRGGALRPFWELVRPLPEGRASPRLPGGLPGRAKPSGRVRRRRSLRRCDDDSRLAVVLAEVEAVPPPGIPAGPFADACRADTYEVLAGLEGILSGIAGGPAYDELLWPDSVLVPASDGAGGGGLGGRAVHHRRGRAGRRARPAPTGDRQGVQVA